MSYQSAFFIVISGCVGLPVLSVQVFCDPGERTELFISLWSCMWTMFSIMMSELHKLHLHNILALWCLSITATIQRAWGQVCWFHMPSLKLLWVLALQRNAHVQSSVAPQPRASEANEAEELWAFFLFFSGWHQFILWAPESLSNRHLEKSHVTLPLKHIPICRCEDVYILAVT